MTIPKKIPIKKIGKKIRFGFTSRITQEKGIIEFINAIKLLKKKTDIIQNAFFILLKL